MKPDYSRSLLWVVCIFVASMLGGCASAPIPISQTKVNADLYPEGVDAFAELVKTQLSRGMSKEDCFTVLRITPQTPNLERLDRSGVRAVLYGGEVRLTTFADTERFNEYQMRLDGYKLPIVSTKRSVGLSSPLYAVFPESGYDIALVMIFEDSKLLEARLTGVRKVEKFEKRFILNLLTGMFVK